MNEILSSEDCHEVIRNFLKNEDFKIQDYQLVDCGLETSGFLGDYFRLNIKFHLNQDEESVVHENQFFVKTLPIKNREKREEIQEGGFFDKEQLLYKHLAPKIKKYSGTHKWSPDCYLAKYGVIVLEDLKIQNYRTTPIRYEYNVDHMHEALKSMAVFHASSIAYETLELKPTGTTIGEKYKEMLFETTLIPDRSFYLCGLRGIQATALEKTKYGIGSKYENQIRTEFFEKLNDIYRIVDEKTPSKVPKVWANRDIWKNNLMFKFESENDLSKPSHCMLVDFQISRYLPLTIDVLILIILCTRARDRKHFMEQYLEFYYGKLTEELVKHNLKIEEFCTWTDFNESCDEVMMVPKMLNAHFISITHMPDGLLANLSKNHPEKYDRVLHENRDIVIFEAMEIDPVYSDYLIEAVEELIEYLFKIEN